MDVDAKEEVATAKKGKGDVHADADTSQPLIRGKGDTSSSTDGGDHGGKKSSKCSGLLVVTFAYVVACGVAAACMWGIDRTEGPLDPLYLGMVGDAIGTVVIFLFSFLFKNSSFYDAYWSVAPVVLGAYWVGTAVVQHDGTPAAVNVVRASLALAVTTLWGVRLTGNWVVSWPGLVHEDWRYTDIRKSMPNPILYWLAGSFLAIHLLPTVIVFLGCVPLYLATYRGAEAISATDIIGVVVSTVAVVIEGVADQQMRNWRKTNPPYDSYIDTGLWRYSRHPNYFGECLFWWGLFLMGIQATSDPRMWAWSVVGPLVVLLLVVGTSIRLMEKRQLEKRPSYRKCIESTSMFIPWFRKKSA